MKLFRSLILFAGCLAVATSCVSIAYAQAQDELSPFECRMITAVFDKKVQKDLELVDDQKTEIKSITNQLKKQQKELGQVLREYANSGATPEEIDEKRKAMVEQFEGHKQVAQQSVVDALLPHQLTRLRQTTSQLMMREFAKKEKVPTGILAPEMKQYLSIDEKQSDRILEKSLAIRQRLAEDIKKLTEDAQKELMEELTKPQREKYEELVGDPLK